ncbi:hypothetical protein FRC02_012140 [Tulasnella sp. 418]|nr:hypothetical protein FRC02_012140 [Tulasnella sp. 418]
MMVLSGWKTPRDVELLCRSWGDTTCMRTIIPTLSASILVLSFVLWSATRSKSKSARSPSEEQTPSTWGQWITSWLKAIFISPFKTFLTVHEALEILHGDQHSHDEGVSARPRINFRMGFMATLALFESLTHIALFSYRVYNLSTKEITPNEPLWVLYTPLLITTVHLYIQIRTLVHPPQKAPLDVFTLIVIFWSGRGVDLSYDIYDKLVFGVKVDRLVMVAKVTDFVTLSLMAVLVLGMPLEVPPKEIPVPPTEDDEEEVKAPPAPEDYTTLWGWISFSWVSPLIERGTIRDLNENDVPDLSFSIQSKPVYRRFQDFKQSTLLRRILAANSLDFFLDCSLTFVSSAASYASPYFLKRMLYLVEHSDTIPHARSEACIYAILTFLAAVAKAEVDVQHLWFGRRFCTRVRSELMALVYEKALKRKDFSGNVKKDAGSGDSKDDEDKAKNKKKSKKEEKEGAQKTGADTGKIVQLMSSDANRIAMMATTGYFIYSSPIEILIASFMLYQLLGWSAFVGFSVLVLASPLNHLLSKRGVTISRGLSAARDKRMGVLNEFIGAISFVKFFAWESQWLKRVHDARTYELGWLKKERANSIIFGLLWTLAPVGVSIVSFFAYVYLGNELTISTAFTAIALFNMLRMPLNVIPMFIVQLLQAGVSLDRIETFLKEEEVPDYVSSFKRSGNNTSPDSHTTALDDDILGLEHCSFKWNEAKDPKEENSKSKGRSTQPELPIATSPTNTETSIPEQGEEALEPERFELRDISVVFPIGKFTIVTGPTASGKSALLMALLGEMTLQPSPSSGPESKVHLPKNPTRVDPATNLRSCISYCAQSPWLEHDSIKNNILFGLPMDEERYNEVLEACALIPDLTRFEDGDETEIGARGVSLSGGQKARVALARAVYARTKFVILDDPLAAVDSHTARHLYEKLLVGPLMANRTLILVTHHIDLVRSGAHYIVRMLDGRVDTQGTIKELEERGLLEIIAHDQVETGTTVHTPEALDDAEAIAEKVVEENPQVTTENNDSGEVRKKKKARKLVKDEARSEGKVKWKIYSTYLRASGWFTWVCLVLLTSSYQGSGVVEKLWIKAWGEHYNQTVPEEVIASYYHVSTGLDHTPSSAHDVLMAGHSSGILWTTNGLTANQRDVARVRYELPSANQHPMFYIAVYAAIGVGAALLSTLNSVVQFFGAFRASKILFKQLLHAVVGSPMRFFDTTPTGRILNRFSRDIEVVDSSLSSSLRTTGSYIASFLAALLTVVIVLPHFFIPAVLIAYTYYRLSYGYVVAGRSLRRMESTTRSPIFAAFGDMLEGLVTVRAFSSEPRFLDNLHSKVDLTTKMWYGFWMTNRYLLLRFDTLGAISTLLTTFFALARLQAGLAALTITSAMAFTSSVYWTCRMITQLEMDLNSVERVVEYLDLPQEPPAVIESNRVPAYWPSSSADPLVVVEDLVIKYAPELPSVLHGVSFALKSRERVGLLGRTGSGKSTLAMALLRFVDPASGKIIIDGIDITSIGLQDLRSRLTIIPQDAVLFSGTIRDNLDPFHEHSDEELDQVLARVHLNSDSNLTSRRSSAAPSQTPSIRESVGDEAASSSAATSSTQLDDARTSVIHLDTKVSAGGANFSQGQRQLIAMARALLRQSSIIIMDEATSSIDFATDALIQKTIREEFSNSLLLTVAHRIRTIIDYDRLLVLDQGNVVEFDTPFNLINKPGGVFREMCLKSGSFDDLFQSAKAKAEGQIQKLL